MKQLMVRLAIPLMVTLAACSSPGVIAETLRPWPLEVEEISTDESCGSGRERVCTRTWVLRPLAPLDVTLAAVESHIEAASVTEDSLNVRCDFPDCVTVLVHDDEIWVLIGYVVGG